MTTENTPSDVPPVETPELPAADTATTELQHLSRDLDAPMADLAAELEFPMDTEEDVEVETPSTPPGTEEDPELIFNMDDVVEDDAPTSLPILLHDVDQTVYAKRLEDIARERGIDHVKAAAATEGTTERHLSDAFRDHMKDPMREINTIKRIANKDNFTDKLMKDGAPVLVPIITPRRKPGAGNTVSGPRGRLELAMRRGQLKRIALYNSGFYVDVTAPTERQMDAFYSKIGDALDTYGREFGAHFYMFNDLVIKQEAAEFILPLVLGATLKNWTKGGNLIRAIRLPDLKTLLWGISTMMWPEGYEYRHVCTNPNTKCTHTETDTIDIRHLYRNNWNLLSEDSVKAMSDLTAVRDMADLDAYQNSLLMNRTITYKDMVLHLKVPTLQDYLAFGNQYNGEIINGLHANNQMGIYKALEHGFYRIFTPWVERIETFKDNKLDVVVTEPDLIASELDYLQTMDREEVVSKQLVAFTGDSEVSHFGYPAQACPACGYRAEDSCGYYTVDPLYSFFTQLVRKLTQRS